MFLDMKMEKEKSLLDIESESESSEEGEYEANIEFSNTCRHYYLSRMEATESFKKDLKKEDSEKTNISPRQRRRPNTIDDKMEELRSEMASLMDQDVSLMKQLLTLNETINEIKQGRLLSSSKGSVGSRGFISGSDLSVSSEADDILRPIIPGFVANPLKTADVEDTVKFVGTMNNKDNEANNKPSDLWKVRTQNSVTSNDSGFVDESSSLLYTEV